MPSFVDNTSSTPIPTVQPLQPHKDMYIHNPLIFRFGKPFRNNYHGEMRPVQPQIKLPIPGEGQPRILHYLADQGGCAFWRLIWPGDELLMHDKGVVMSMHQMILDAQFYEHIDAIRIQRQCTPQQLQFIKFLRDVSEQYKKQGKKGFRIIYEADDLVGPLECLPEYNACREAFADPNLINTVKEIVSYCDEFTVPSEVMKQHYRKYLDYDRITMIPNYVPRSWLDKGVTEYEKIKQYRLNKKKPRILYAGSSTHFDLLNKTNQKDDFGHVVDYIIDDIMNKKKYQWVFIGGVPLRLHKFILDKTIEYYPWSNLSEYPRTLKDAGAQLMIAPLADNVFSRAKANIKLTEGGAMGIPVIAQNLDCYKGWKYSFNTGAQMMQIIADTLSSEVQYTKAVRYAKEYTDQYWLDEHLDEWVKIYTTPYGSKERQDNEFLVANNPEQFLTIEG